MVQFHTQQRARTVNSLRRHTTTHLPYKMATTSAAGRITPLSALRPHVVLHIIGTEVKWQQHSHFRLILQLEKNLQQTYLARYAISNEKLIKICKHVRNKTSLYITPKTYLYNSKLEISGGFRGGRAGSARPPPLGDGLVQSLTVLLICDNGSV